MTIWRARVNSLFAVGEIEGEKLSAYIRFLAVAGLLILQVWLLLYGHEDYAAGVAGTCLAILAMAAGIGFLILLKTAWRGWYPYLGVAIDLVVVTTGALLSGTLSHQESGATKSPYVLVFFLVIALTGLRQRPRLAWFVAIGSVLGFGTLIWAVFYYTPERFTSCLNCDISGNDVSMVRVVTEMIIFLIAGGITWSAAWRGRRLSESAVKEEMAKQQLLSIASRYFPRGALGDMEEQSGVLEPRLRLVSILTCDIRGFSKLSEDCPSEVLLENLNLFFSEITEIVFANDGVLLSFVGDAAWALFGIPLASGDDRRRAVKSGLVIQERLLVLNKEGRFKGVGELKFGIAVHSGEALVGSVGSPMRLEYTAIGGAMNAVARMEKANKVHNTMILISATAAEGLEEEFDLIEKGEVKVGSVSLNVLTPAKNDPRPVTIY